MTIKSTISNRLSRAKQTVFMRSDFEDVGGYDQVGRVLRELVTAGKLMKIGYGLYAKARINRITGKIMPDNNAGADGVLIEALQRLGTNYTLDDLSQLNIDGLSTQIPSQVKVKPTSSRFKRKIVIGNQGVNLDR
ncbi:S-adenosylhomocysteine hydrolase [Saccharobesus litoralis]|uniref:S-adenosylhomocysteine hydrolase n=1 Tax=Saccharobesus litoralis TaxID=2172099 RepID=A0A2S0VNZ2_9ALTE|nr:DUF6088 family protein [Saccharobesus litoralis]AWB65924.1 S-adenosylhomocysteine hydrolase [Saccharobesus litoralis]